MNLGNISNRLNETKSNNSDCNKVNEQVNPEGKGFAVDEIRWAKSGVIIGIFQPIFVLVIVAIFVLVSAIFVAVFLATLFLAVVICDFIVFWKKANFLRKIQQQFVNATFLSHDISMEVLKFFLWGNYLITFVIRWVDGILGPARVWKRNYKQLLIFHCRQSTPKYVIEIFILIPSFASFPGKSG